MIINIKLTDEQKEDIKRSMFAEVTEQELASELFSKLSIRGLESEESLRNELFLYLKSLDRR